MQTPLNTEADLAHARGLGCRAAVDQRRWTLREVMVCCPHPKLGGIGTGRAQWFSEFMVAYYQARPGD